MINEIWWKGQLKYNISNKHKNKLQMLVFSFDTRDQVTTFESPPSIDVIFHRL